MLIIGHHIVVMHFCVRGISHSLGHKVAYSRRYSSYSDCMHFVNNDYTSSCELVVAVKIYWKANFDVESLWIELFPNTKQAIFL